MSDLKQTKANVRKNARERLVNHTAKYNESGCNSALCKTCLLKYRDTESGLLWPQCKMSADVQVERQKRFGLLDKLSPEERMVYQYTRDPVIWAKVMFDYEARWYQMELLRCTSQKKVARCGRRVGKTDALAVKILHASYTKPGRKPNERYTVLVICPYEKQVEVIFRRIREFIGQCPELKNSIKRDVANPHQIEFDNMATIIGVSAGVRTGAKADQIRGQDADFLALDEADYLDEGSIESILAIFASKSDCILWASSTPTGARSYFYKWCKNKSSGFREFHYPSSVSPDWTPETELMFREQYTEAAYNREFMAEFGEEDAGVFQHRYVQRSLYDYDIETYQKDPNNLYSMGVDWNSTGFGTHIVVTEYNTSSHKFRVVAKEIIDVSEFTQMAGIEKILQMDSYWDCEFIYVDAGYGTTQVEFLKKYGLDNPRSRMGKKLKPIEFGGKTQVRDPYSQEIVKKHTKPLIVELCARRLESLQVEFPTSEDGARGLVGQVRVFRVEKYGRDGQPIYSQGEDHTLIAWMLSVFALIMEFTDLAKITPTTRVAFTGSGGGGDHDALGADLKKQKKARAQRLAVKPRWLEAGGSSPSLNRLSEHSNMQRAESNMRRSGRGGTLPPARRKNF